jgi:hypothetical protein
MIKTPQKKKSRMHQTPTQTNKSKDFNYSVNYTESLNQMAANLSVYGQLTEIKNKERNELETNIRATKLAIKHVQ